MVGLLNGLSQYQDGSLYHLGFKAMIREWGQPLILFSKNGLNLSLVLTVKQCSCTCCGSSVASHGVAQMTSNNYPLPLRVAKDKASDGEKESERVMKMRVMTTLIRVQKVLLPCLL